MRVKGAHKVYLAQMKDAKVIRNGRLHKGKKSRTPWTGGQLFARRKGEASDARMIQGESKRYGLGLAGIFDQWCKIQKGLPAVEFQR